MHEPPPALLMAAAVATAPGASPIAVNAALNRAGELSVTRTMAQYAAVGPDTVGMGLAVPACTLTVSPPAVVNPLEEASIQALSKSVEGEVGAAAGQLAGPPQ